jgi:hypothetical protein
LETAGNLDCNLNPSAKDTDVNCDINFVWAFKTNLLINKFNEEFFGKE